MGRGAQAAFSAGKAEHGDQTLGRDHRIGNFFQRHIENDMYFSIHISPHS